MANIDIGEIARRSNRELDELLERLSSGVLTEVRRATPVVTGNLLKGWEKHEHSGGIDIKNEVVYAAKVNEKHNMVDAGVSIVPSILKEHDKG